MLTGAASNVCVRSAEVWLKGHESKLSREITGELRQRLEELETTLKRGNLRVQR